MELSIVIPAYNEEKRLPGTLEKVFTYFRRKSELLEVIVADDGSTDQTAAIVEKMRLSYPLLKIVRNPRNLGKGGAVRNGMLAAKGDWILFMDADLSTPIEEYEKIKPSFITHQVVIGTRKKKGADVRKRQPWLREHLGKGFTLLACWLMQTRITDFTCGFKAFSREARDQVFGRAVINNWSYDAELVFLINKYKLPLVEVPVVWINDEGTKVNLLRDVVTSLWGLLKIRFYAWRGVYGSGE